MFTGLFGRSSQSTSSSNITNTTTLLNQYDQRVALGNDAMQLGAGAVANSGNTFTVQAVDGGSVAMAQYNAQLLQALGETQGDTVKALAMFGSDSLKTQGDTAAQLFSTSTDAAAKSWATTINASSELIDKFLASAEGTIRGAQTVASDAIHSYQPTENKQADVLKYAAIAGAITVGFLVLNKA